MSLRGDKLNDSLEPTTSKSHRVLCIDGGGIKRTLPAAILKELEADLQNPIGDYFGLIAGTSTGGILAFGLARGRSAEELLSLCQTRGPTICEQEDLDPDTETWLANNLRSLRDTRRHFTGPNHDADILTNELRPVLWDAKTRRVVPAWDPDDRRLYIY